MHERSVDQNLLKGRFFDWLSLPHKQDNDSCVNITVRKWAKFSEALHTRVGIRYWKLFQSSHRMRWEIMQLLKLQSMNAFCLCNEMQYKKKIQSIIKVIAFLQLSFFCFALFLFGHAISTTINNAWFSEENCKFLIQEYRGTSGNFRRVPACPLI